MTDCCCAQEKAAMRAKIVRLEAEGSKAMSVVMALQEQVRRRDEAFDKITAYANAINFEHMRSNILAAIREAREGSDDTTNSE